MLGAKDGPRLRTTPHVLLAGAGIGGLTCSARASQARHRRRCLRAGGRAARHRRRGADQRKRDARVVRARTGRGARGGAVRAGREGSPTLEQRPDLEALRPGRRLRGALRAPYLVCTAPIFTACSPRRYAAKSRTRSISARDAPGSFRRAVRVTLEFEGGGRAAGDAAGRRRRRAFDVAPGVFGAARPDFTGLIAWRGVIPRRPAAAAASAWSARTGSGPAGTSSTIRCGAGADELRRRGRARRLADRVVDGAGHARRMRRAISPAGTTTCSR